MPQSSTLSIGMDGHKDSIAVAYVLKHTTLRFSPAVPSVRASTISTNSSGTCRPKANLWALSMKQECGYWLYRYLTPKGHICWVVAPSLIPTKPGDRVKTNRRDAI
jgi:transposase